MSNNVATNNARERKETTMLKAWIGLSNKARRGTQHNQISRKWRNRENHMGKTFLQKEIEKCTNDVFQETLLKP